MGAALLLYGLAIALSDIYAKWLGCKAVTVRSGWILLGLLVAYDGFTKVTLTMSVSVLLALWVVVLAAFLWRKAGKTPSS